MATQRGFLRGAEVWSTNSIVLRDSKKNWNNSAGIWSQTSSLSGPCLRVWCRFALDEKQFDGYKFEWTPYQSMWPEFLRLNDVPAIFSDRGSAYVVLQDCKVRFARRPLKSGGEFWQDAESPLDQIEWSLNPVAKGDSVVWYVPELQKTLSSAALAEQIAIDLSRYHTAYQKAYGR